MTNDTVKRACDVCVILDKDHTEKDVRFCNLCGKYLCDKCRGDGGRRVHAATVYHGKRLAAAFLTGLGITPVDEEEKN